MDAGEEGDDEEEGGGIEEGGKRRGSLYPTRAVADAYIVRATGSEPCFGSSCVSI